MILISRLLFKKEFVKSFVFFCVLFFQTSLRAQQVDALRFQSLTIIDGLSQGYISGMIQDKLGFMWFSTGDGLNKFDGNNFTVYNHDRDNDYSIGSGDLSCVFEDSKGRLWIGTRQDGLDFFERRRNKFIHIRHSKTNGPRSDKIIGIKEDQSGALWIRTVGGIDRMEITDRPDRTKKTELSFTDSIKFTHIQLGKELDAQRINSGPENIFIDSWGQVFLTTNDRVLEVIYNKNKRDYQVLERYRFKPLDQSFIPEIAEDTIGHFLLLNNKNVIKFSGYDFANAHILYKYNPLQVEWIIDKNEVLWLLNRQTLVQINLRTSGVRNIIPFEQSQLPAINSITNFFIDKTGLIWIGSGGYGILKYDPDIALFHLMKAEGNTYQILLSSSGSVITNNFQEISIKDSSVDIRRILNPRIIKNFPKYGILSMAKDTSQNLWFGTNGSLISYNRVTKTTVARSLPETGQTTLPFPVFVDSTNNVWMGYNKTLVEYEQAANRFTLFKYPTDLENYEYDFLQSIYEENGSIWLGSVNGVFRLDLKTRRITKHYQYIHGDSTSLGSNFVLSFCKDFSDPSRYLWVGTKGGGLNRLDKYSGKFVRYDTKKGLSNNVVYGILPDGLGNLWLSTNKGLSALNVRLSRFKNFDATDGLQGNEFNRYAYCQMGEYLIFGGLNGINYFNPKDIKPLAPPDVVFTQLRLFNKPVVASVPGSPLKENINSSSRVVLKYAQNVVTFQFAAMDFRKPGNIVYRYQMEGFDKGYIFSANTYEATYTNLDPGEYRFIVQASFKNGVWGKKVRSLLVIVVPPWYKTWWFYTLAVSSTISFTYLVYRERLLQLARLNKLRNRIARDLHDEVGSSVSSIAIYSKIVHDHINNTTFDNEPLLKKIADYATEIMNSMNDIVWNINTKNDAFEHIINRMREHAYQLFEAKGYSLHFEFDENLKRSKLSMENRREFYLIYKEALNNVAKYANGKTVWITLTLNQKLISLTIKDDGQGFDLANLKKGGNGLANMRFRAASLKGKITIISSPSEGTEIQLKFLA